MAQDKAAARVAKRRTTTEEVGLWSRSKDLQKLHTRRWKGGDVYAPHDLSSVEMQKWRRSGKPTMDAFDALALNPEREYKVCSC